MMIILGIHLIKNMCVYSSLAIEPKLCSMQYYFEGAETRELQLGGFV